MSEFGKLLGLCQNCKRYNPRGVANCLLAKDAGYLAHKWKKYNLMVTDCEEFLIVAQEAKAKAKAKVTVPKEENGTDIVVGATLKKEKDE